jgi:hypothetical protein
MAEASGRAGRRKAAKTSGGEEQRTVNQVIENAEKKAILRIRA